MTRTRQRTLAQQCSYKGIGIHTGEEATVTFRPAPPDSGVSFVRTDIEGAPTIPASLTHVVRSKDTPRRTTLSKDGVKIYTVEHVLAALMGLGIDNVVVEIDSAEPAEPVDGSCKPFVDILTSAGLEEQDAPLQHLEILEPVSFEHGDVCLTAAPHDGLRLSFLIDYDNPTIGTQYASFDVTEETFVSEIAPARTFALESDVAGLKEQGLIRGGSLENAILVGEDGVVNEGELRFPDEFARHKVLDLLGDLALLGRPLRGSVHAKKSGHATNVRFVEAIRDAVRQGKVRYGATTNWDIDAIEEVMPHRYPFLLVDRILELDSRRVVGTKSFTMNEWFFVGHFPGHPIVPAVLIIEAMAQVGGFLLLSRVEDREKKLVYFMGIDNARFRRPVRPGDTVRFELELLRLRGGTCKMRGSAYVKGDLVADGDLWSQVVDR
ncbi:MAG: bifunctional UDP-3-O-[3-hydroxymyristoyl] N-acetylglucosamine deacetylase/3-hydroxyacyl-ACP dehydratase [Candidatus Eisenbacteria bacterium]|nr:bifunctional UDP-3-O-[3-hydroxymyristoyl] N-acetylglucosamine deacetylase/3-hydroxyacyl-ACP dehydratase [Candidatus Eisenbacteria bacterium]